MLLSPGAESHSFEPTPGDMITVSECDLFVYVGGDSDAWVETILDSVDTSNKEVVTLMDCVDTVAEETVEGMETHGHAHDHEDEDADHDEDSHDHEDESHGEQDEHVWTSPKNAMRIVQKLCDALCRLDPENADDYQANTASYLASLTSLDEEFSDVTTNASRHTIVFGDRFPFRYFADAYGLDYYAAFPGCSSESEASAKTLSFLTAQGPLLVVTAGDAKIDNHKYKETFSCKAKMLTPEEAVELVGHAVGGVCPFALPEDVKTYLDVSLKRFDTVFPAVGSAASAIELTCDELERCCGANFVEWVDVCKGWQEEQA